jgi:hypothetical protein
MIHPSALFSRSNAHRRVSVCGPPPIFGSHVVDPEHVARASVLRTLTEQSLNAIRCSFSPLKARESAARLTLGHTAFAASASSRV